MKNFIILFALAFLLFGCASNKSVVPDYTASYQGEFGTFKSYLHKFSSDPIRYKYTHILNDVEAESGVMFFVNNIINYSVETNDDFGVLLKVRVEPDTIPGIDRIYYFRLFLTDPFVNDIGTYLIRCEDENGEIISPIVYSPSVISFRNPYPLEVRMDGPLYFNGANFIVEDEFDSDSILLAALTVLNTEYLGFDDSKNGYHKLLSEFLENKNFKEMLVKWGESEKSWISESAVHIITKSAGN